MAAQPRTAPLAGELTLAQLRKTIKPAPQSVSGPTVEVIGRRVDPFAIAKQRIALEMAVAEAVLPHQLHEIDTVVEIAHLQELLDEKESRVSLLSMGIAQWRERAVAESDARRREQRSAHDRERDLVRVIHQQMITIEQQSQALETAEQNVTDAHLKIREMEIRIDGLRIQASQRRKHWWQRG